MDIATLPRADGAGYDIAVDNGALAMDASLQTDITLSLLTDRRADNSEAEALGANASRRGWWGDALNARPVGSRLWLLRREKLTADVLTTAADYAQEALDWLVTRGRVDSLNVTASAVRLAGAGNKEALALAVRIVRGAEVQIFNVNVPGA
ncbi:hypothetical protein AZ34_11825 [Hylemonella gracilis str. Niagara R]|uniref:Mu-like prophage protein gp46 n=1 Tax=Hylemonella gracilis str. Niagara R TaxID=1458275 RepID=A0A016XJG5_9BURK|nr:phage GP46 family protein [Hylemonella gracilis]EYC51697.1 hypothetical protein AZ34_11825 [Hylemonella gracilis str. Niagara R]